MPHMDSTQSSIELRARVRGSRISQDRLARMIGMDRSALSRVLSGYQPPPAGFEDRVYAALDAFECAEVAAEEARRRVLAEYAARHRPQRHERRKGMGESPARIRAMAMPGAAS